MLKVTRQTTIPKEHRTLAPQPTKGALNGLITNDKFCMIQSVQLRLSGLPNYPLRLQATQGSKSQYPPMRNLIAEESMKHQWCTHREFKAYPDGQLGWDRAYQYLLQWIGNESAATENQPQEGRR